LEQFDLFGLDVLHVEAQIILQIFFDELCVSVEVLIFRMVFHKSIVVAALKENLERTPELDVDLVFYFILFNSKL